MGLFCNVQKVVNGTNGKKRYIVGSGVTAAFLIRILLGFNTGIVANATELKAHKEAIEKVEETPTKIALIQRDVEHLKDDFSEFKIDQKQTNEKFDNKLDRILEAVR